jgi:hypothetical protein
MISVPDGSMSKKLIRRNSRRRRRRRKGRRRERGEEDQEAESVKETQITKLLNILNPDPDTVQEKGEAKLKKVECKKQQVNQKAGQGRRR